MQLDIKGNVQTTNDLAPERIVTNPFGADFIVKRSDPFGLWSVQYENGKTPKELEGNFTRPEYAFAKIKNFLENKEQAQLNKRPAKVKLEPRVTK